MVNGRVTLVCSIKNTFVTKDIQMLEGLGFKVFLIHSPPYSDPIRFMGNRIREFFLGFYFLFRSEGLFSWFNDYHTTLPLFWARFFKKKTVIIVGGYDAVSSQSLGYGIFVKKNLRQFLARKNYQNTDQILVVHKSLAEGCSNASLESGTHSGIKHFLPDLKTTISEVPTAYDSNYWKLDEEKTAKTILTVANISDYRTFERKGIPLFLDLASAMPDFKFTIAGIQKLNLYKSEFPSNVSLLGTQSREQLKKLYGQHRFYFQGSLIEGLPNVLCEAMLCECIPVGKDVFGISDAIGASGLVFKPNEKKNSIIDFFIHATPSLGKAARQRISELYPIERRKSFFQKILQNAESNG